MGNIDMIENLLNANSNINMADKTNWTALDYLENHIIRNSKDRDPEDKAKLTQIRHKMSTQMDKFLKKSGLLKEKIGILLKNIGDEDSIDDVVQDDFIEVGDFTSFYFFKLSLEYFDFTSFYFLIFIGIF